MPSEGRRAPQAILPALEKRDDCPFGVAMLERNEPVVSLDELERRLDLVHRNIKKREKTDHQA